MERTTVGCEHQHEAMPAWGIFVVSDRAGRTCDVRTSALQLIIGGAAPHLRAESAIDDASFGVARRLSVMAVAQSSSGDSVPWPGDVWWSPVDVTISDEELLLLLWGRVVSFVASMSIAHTSVGVVVAVPGPTHWLFLRRSIEDLTLQHPALRIVLLVPAPPPSRILTLKAMHEWSQTLAARSRLDIRTSTTVHCHITKEDAEESTTAAPLQRPPTDPPLMEGTHLMGAEFINDVVATVASSPSRVVLVSGPTGCGKSTKVPMAIMDASPEHVVWVAQPRRVAAVSLCRRIAAERRGIADDVAYSIGGSRSHDEKLSHTARVTFMTSGVMLQRVKSAFRDGAYLNDCNVTHIILDEVHERTVEYDLLMCMLREVLRYNRTLRLILTSATMSCRGLQQYMTQHYSRSDCPWPPTSVCAAEESPTSLSVLRRTHQSDETGDNGKPATPILSFHSSARRRRTFYIEEAFRVITDAVCKCAKESPSTSDRIFQSTFSESGDLSFEQPTAARGTMASLKVPFTLHSVLAKPTHKDSLVWEARFSMTAWLVRILHNTRPLEEAILVFFSGIQQLEALQTELLEHMGCTEMHIVLLHSSNDAENNSLFDPPPPNTRKVLIATNIAESSLTIPDVDHVVDTCVVKDQRYLHDEDLGMLEECYCSKDSCEQRAGRTGRVRPGSVWRLVTRAEYDCFEEGRVPGVMQTPLTSTMLLVADANVGELDPFLAALPAPPPLRGVLVALTQLTEHYRALAPCQLRGSHMTFLQPTLKGIALSALGLPVAIGELVLTGVMCGIPVVAAQAGAILASTAPLVGDDGGYLLCNFDHGTGCDLVANVELLRWWIRQIDTPFPEAADDASCEDNRAMRQEIKRHVRSHILVEVRAKARDIMKTLASFGMALPSFLQLASNRSARWEAAEDVTSLTPPSLMMLIATITLAFPHRTAAANDIHAKNGSKGRRNVYTPSHKVSLVLRGVATASDEERISEHIRPATCTIRTLTENRVLVDTSVERVVDTFMNVPDYHAFHVRNVRNITFDAYRLIKSTRAERRELNIAYADSGDDVHLLSSWFVESRAPIFIDRSSVLYPLVFDASVSGAPSVVSCNAARRENRVVYLTNLLLPGSLAVLPVVLAAVLHWDGRTLDDRHCLLLPTLPHCHPSPKRIRQKSADLYRLVASLRETASSLFEKVMGFYGTQEYLEAQRVAPSSVPDRFLVPAFQRLDKLSTRLCGDLSTLLCVFLDQIPKYYAPNHVAQFVADHAHLLPSDVSSQQFVTEACSLSRKGTLFQIHHADEANSLPPLPAQCPSLAPSTTNHHPSLLVNRALTRQSLTLHQLHQYHRYQLRSNAASHDDRMHGGSSILGDTINQPWTEALLFPKRHARSIPHETTCASFGKHVAAIWEGLLSNRQREAAGRDATSNGGIIIVDLSADVSCGLVAFYTAIAASERLLGTLSVVLRCGAAWSRDIIRRNVQLLSRHAHPNLGTMCRWHTTQNKGGIIMASPALTSCDRIFLVFIPPSRLQATPCGEFMSSCASTMPSDASAAPLCEAASGLTETESEILRHLIVSYTDAGETGCAMDSVHMVATERERTWLAAIADRWQGAVLTRCAAMFDPILSSEVIVYHLRLDRRSSGERPPKDAMERST